MGWEEGVLLHILSSQSSSLLRDATTGLVFLPCTGDRGLLRGFLVLYVCEP